MSEINHSKQDEPSLQTKPDIACVLAQMQQKLDSMEHKIDALIRQFKQTTLPAAHPPKKNWSYDKTKRPKDRKLKEKTDEVSSEGKFYHGRPFGGKKAGAKKGFKRKKI